MHQRQGDRDDGDDDGDGGDDDGGDDEARRRAERRATKLAKSRENLTQIGFPIFLRFVDLEAAGIVQSWAQLGHLIRDEKFPEGVMLSSNVRAWPLTAVTDWLASRAAGRLPPEGKLRERDKRAAAEVAS